MKSLIICAAISLLAACSHYTQVSGALDDVYTKCKDDEGGCIVEDSACLDKKDCKYIVYSNYEDDAYNFYVGSSNKDFQYVSIGFSNDTKMGNELTVDCVKESTTVVKTYLAANTGGHKHETATATDPNFMEGANGAEDGGFYCYFMFHGPVKSLNTDVDLENESYTVLLAGGLVEGNKIKMHTKTDRFASGEKNFNGAATILSSGLLLISSYILARFW